MISWSLHFPRMRNRESSKDGERNVSLDSQDYCPDTFPFRVSWNFRHIVHFDKIPLYNGVNLINGFESISINTPAEVIAYET